MNLQKSTDRYIAWRRLHGAVFRDEAGILEKFAGRFDSNIGCEEIGHANAAEFLDETGSSARRCGSMPDSYRIFPLRCKPRLRGALAGAAA